MKKRLTSILSSLFKTGIDSPFQDFQPKGFPVQENCEISISNDTLQTQSSRKGGRRNAIFYFSIFISLFFFNISNAEEIKQKLDLSAENIDFINGNEGERYVKATGSVEVLYAKYKLCSGELILDEKEDKITAKNDVILMERESGGATIKTDLIEGNKELSKASISSFTFEKETVYGTAEGGTKEGEIIRFKDLKVSTCENAKNNDADWAVMAKTAEYDKEKDQISLYNTLFYAKEVPIFWLPFFTISPSRTHGFLAPEAGYYNSQYYIALPYYISEKTKTHYLVLKPEFYAYSSEPENRSRVNNFYSSYSYKKINDEVFIEGKIAPNAYFQDEPLGTPSDEKKNRYYLNANGNFEYAKGNYGFEYGSVSDRFFRKSYESETENYLKKDLYFNFFDDEKTHTFTIENLSFVPIAFEKTDDLPSIDILSNYLFQKDLQKNVKLYDETNVISVSRKDGVEYARISNSFGVEIKNDFGILKNVINPEIRGDIYSKNYKTQEDQSSETLIRAIPSLFVENKIPIYFKLKNNSDYLFKIEPQLNFFWTRENINNNRIIAEDSGNAFLNADTILLKNYFSGYDIIDEGLSGIYGTSAMVKHGKSNSFGEIFIGQRAKVLLQQSENKPSYSEYAGKLGFSIFETFDTSVNFLFSEDFDLRYSLLNTGLTFKFIELRFQNTFILKEIAKQPENVSENKYSVKLKLPEYNASFTFTLTQNNKFLNENNDVSRRTVYSEYLFSYLADCFEYSLGIKRERYTVEDRANKYEIFGKFRLLLI